MKLYHGTSARLLSSALKHGLRPRDNAASNWEENPSRPDMVYLTTVYPFYFGCLSQETKELVVFEIDGNALDKQSFFPDEDFITELFRLQDGKELDPCEKGEIRIMIRRYQDQWRNSLRFLGTCAYKGVVPPSAMTRYCLFTPALRPYLTAEFVDSLINTLNFQCCGASLKKTVAWMFGDRKTLPMVAEAETAEERALWLKESRDRRGIEVVEVKRGRG